MAVRSSLSSTFTPLGSKRSNSFSFIVPRIVSEAPATADARASKLDPTASGVGAVTAAVECC